LRTELAHIDKRLASLAHEKMETEAALSSTQVTPSDIADLGRRLHHISAETAMLEERWLELQEQLEAAQKGAEPN
jgi:ATP-binding cassette subfamily F protein 3